MPAWRQAGAGECGVERWRAERQSGPACLLHRPFRLRAPGQVRRRTTPGPCVAVCAVAAVPSASVTEPAPAIAPSAAPVSGPPPVHSPSPAAAPARANATGLPSPSKTTPTQTPKRAPAEGTVKGKLHSPRSASLSQQQPFSQSQPSVRSEPEPEKRSPIKGPGAAAAR